VLRGNKTLVTTKYGNVVVLSETEYEKLVRKKKPGPLDPKIPVGKIDLDGADEALRAYIRIPT
jgi:hypothetical protein